MEALGRVELPTNSLGNCCSIHLSYRAVSSDYRMLARDKWTGGETQYECVSLIQTDDTTK